MIRIRLDSINWALRFVGLILILEQCPTNCPSEQRYATRLRLTTRRAARSRFHGMIAWDPGWERLPTYEERIAEHRAKWGPE